MPLPKVNTKPKAPVKRAPRAVPKPSKAKAPVLKDLTKTLLVAPKKVFKSGPKDFGPCWGTKPGCVGVGKLCTYCKDFVCDIHIQRNDDKAVVCRKCVDPATRIERQR